MNQATDSGHQQEQQHGELIEKQTQVDREVPGLQQGIERHVDGTGLPDLRKSQDGQNERPRNGGNPDPVAVPLKAAAAQGEGNGGQQRKKRDEEIQKRHIDRLSSS